MEEYNYKNIFLLENLMNNVNINDNIELFIKYINKMNIEAPKYINFYFFKDKFLEFFKSIKNDEDLNTFNIIKNILLNKKELKDYKIIYKSLLDSYSDYIRDIKTNKIKNILNKLILENINSFDFDTKCNLINLISFDILDNKDVLVNLINDSININNIKLSLKLINKLDVEKIWEGELSYKNINKSLINDLIIKQLSKNEIDFLFQMFSNYRNIILNILELMSKKQYKSILSTVLKLIKQNNFDINKFPDILNLLRNKKYRGILNYGFEKLEDYLLSNKSDIHIVIEILKNKDHLNYFKEKYLNIKNESENTNKIVNKIFENDNFGPIEYLLNDKEKEDYISLESLGIAKNQVILINNNTEKEIMDSMKKDILNSEILGLDGEFYSSDDFEDFSKLSWFQIANNNKIYLLDIISFKNNYHEIVDFLKKMFENPNIIKIGHTFKSDIEVISNTLDNTIDYKSIININELVNGYIKNIGLKDIAFHYYKKYFCKYNQTSNWKRRPLRESQLHYAALDSYIVLLLYKKIIVDEDLKSYKEKNKNIVDTKDINENNFKVKIKNIDDNNIVLNKIINDINYTYNIFEINQILNYYYNCVSYFDGNPRFITDARSFSKKLRKKGIDTEFIDKFDTNSIINIAEKEKRIIIAIYNEYNVLNRNCIVYNIRSKKSYGRIEELEKQFSLKYKKIDDINVCFNCNDKYFIKYSFKEITKLYNFLEENENLKNKFFNVCIKCNYLIHDNIAKK